jgi:hypothetical protein
VGEAWGWDYLEAKTSKVGLVCGERISTLQIIQTLPTDYTMFSSCRIDISLLVYEPLYISIGQQPSCRLIRSKQVVGSRQVPAVV